MPWKRLKVGNIYNRAKYYRDLFSLANQVLSSPQPEVMFDFSDTNFIAHFGVAFLGGLARLCERMGGAARFDWSTATSPVMANLSQNGFAATFGHTANPWQGNSVPYREDPPGPASQAKLVMPYLKSRWLGRDWIQMSDGLARAILGNVCEVYANAFDHGSSPVGVFSCGQRYPTKQVLSLCVVDFGVGIPGPVRSHLAKPAMTASDALDWAFQSGTTTKPVSDQARGLGLDVLRRFVEANQGKLVVYSEDGRAEIRARGSTFSPSAQRFCGTLVDITLNCNDKFYTLGSERAGRAPLFG